MESVLESISDWVDCQGDGRNPCCGIVIGECFGDELDHMLLGVGGGEGCARGSVLVAGTGMTGTVYCACDCAMSASMSRSPEEGAVTVTVQCVSGSGI